MNITSNNINGILDLRNYCKLENILCSANKLTNIKLCNNIKINTLCCSSNNIKNFILKAGYIDTINCTSCNITEAIIDFRFRNLNISYNPLTKITFKQHTKLLNIKIDQETLRIISPFSFTICIINKFQDTEFNNSILRHSAAYCIQKLWYSYKLKIEGLWKRKQIVIYI